MLYVSLVWNLNIEGGTLPQFNNTATLYDLDLALHDVTDPANPQLVSGSTGTGDNTENLWVPLAPGRAYQLVVSRGQAQAPFDFDYALAWRMTEPPDTDGDSLPDDWEVYYGLSHLDSSDADEDPDEDGLINSDECLRGTDPRNPDTDGDGFIDGDEVQAGANPLDPNSHPAEASVPALGSWTLVAVLLILIGLANLANGARPRP